MKQVLFFILLLSVTGVQAQSYNINPDATTQDYLLLKDALHYTHMPNTFLHVKETGVGGWFTSVDRSGNVVPDGYTILACDDSVTALVRDISNAAFLSPAWKSDTIGTFSYYSKLSQKLVRPFTINNGPNQGLYFPHPTGPFGFRYYQNHWQYKNVSGDWQDIAGDTTMVVNFRGTLKNLDSLNVRGGVYTYDPGSTGPNPDASGRSTGTLYAFTTSSKRDWKGKGGYTQLVLDKDDGKIRSRSYDGSRWLPWHHYVTDISEDSIVMLHGQILNFDTSGIPFGEYSFIASTRGTRPSSSNADDIGTIILRTATGAKIFDTTDNQSANATMIAISRSGNIFTRGYTLNGHFWTPWKAYLTTAYTENDDLDSVLSKGNITARSMFIGSTLTFNNTQGGGLAWNTGGSAAVRAWADSLKMSHSQQVVLQAGAGGNKPFLFRKGGNAQFTAILNPEGLTADRFIPLSITMNGTPLYASSLGNIDLGNIGSGGGGGSGGMTIEDDGIDSVLRKGATTSRTITVGEVGIGTAQGSGITFNAGGAGDISDYTDTLKLSHQRRVAFQTNLGSADNLPFTFRKGTTSPFVAIINPSGLTANRYVPLSVTANSVTFYASPLGNIDLGNIGGGGTGGTETDPVFGASPAKNITNSSITNWNLAFGWGNHATQGYLTNITGKISAGTNVAITGLGTAASPYVISASGGTGTGGDCNAINNSSTLQVGAEYNISGRGALGSLHFNTLPTGASMTDSIMTVDGSGDVHRMDIANLVVPKSSTMTVTTITATLPNVSVQHLYVLANYTPGTTTITLPSASANDEKDITIKNITNNNVSIVGAWASEPNTMVPFAAEAFTYHSSNGTWYMMAKK